MKNRLDTGTGIQIETSTWNDGDGTRTKFSFVRRAPDGKLIRRWSMDWFVTDQPPRRREPYCAGCRGAPHSKADCAKFWCELARYEAKAALELISDAPELVETSQNMLKEAYDQYLHSLDDILD